MGLTSAATEQTSAATDLILALTAALAAVYLRRARAHDKWKVDLWSWVFGLTGLAALLGAVLHGVELSTRARDALWQPLYLALGFVVSLFIVAALYDLLGRRTAQRMLPVMIVVALVFWSARTVFGGSFRSFVVFEAIGLVGSLAIYTWLAASRRLPGAGVIALAMALNLGAAGLQSSGTVSVTLLWQFDHNGVFHLVQCCAMVVLAYGLRRGLEQRCTV